MRFARVGRAAPARPVAWLSLDEDDSPPSRFLAYLAAALVAALVAALEAPPLVVQGDKTCRAIARPRPLR